MARNATVPALAGLVAASWTIPVIEYARFGGVSLLSVATAVMFTVMLALLPLFSGRRLHKGRPERATMCRECHALRWPGDATISFCIHCGSARPPVPAVLA